MQICPLHETRRLSQKVTKCIMVNMVVLKEIVREVLMLQSYLICEQDNTRFNDEDFKTLVDGLRDAIYSYTPGCDSAEIAVLEIVMVG